MASSRRRVLDTLQFVQTRPVPTAFHNSAVVAEISGLPYEQFFRSGSAMARAHLQAQARFGYDDTLDAFGVHGAGGTIGALLTGIFASSAINPIFKDAKGATLASGIIEGNFHQIFGFLRIRRVETGHTCEACKLTIILLILRRMHGRIVR